MAHTNAHMPVCHSDSRKRNPLPARQVLLRAPFLSLVRTRKEGNFPQTPQDPRATFVPSLGVILCDPHLPTFPLPGLTACPLHKGKGPGPAPAGHPPCLERTAWALRSLPCPAPAGLPDVPSSLKSRSHQPPAELEWWQEQLIFQGLGCDVIAFLGTSSLHL